MLLTSAPVAIRRVATPMLPLDLHVLSLSLAFILSQDQTLRCVYLVCLFSLKEKGLPRHINQKPSRSACTLSCLIGEHDSRHALTCHYRNLDRRSAESPFLVSHLLVNFLTANISMTSCLPALSAPLFGKASKKPLNSEQVLVSRKAMQNYNRFLEQANIFTTFFQKNAVFLRFARFRTPEGRFRTAASAPQPAFSTWRPPVSIAVVQQCTGPEGRDGKPRRGKATGGEGKATRGEKRHTTGGKGTPT